MGNMILNSTKKQIRNDFLIALLALPLYVAGIARYGYKQGILLICCLIIGFAVEKIGYVLRKKKEGGFDFAAWVLFPLVLPPAFPLAMSLICFACGVVVAVLFFGGHGRQLTSSVAVGWAFSTASFSNAFRLGWTLPFREYWKGFSSFSTSFFITEHPVEYYRVSAATSPMEILMGNYPGTVAGAIPLVTIVCGVLLVLLRGTDIKVAFSYLFTVFILTGALNLLMPETVLPVHTLLVGNLIFTAFFILPDQRTASRTAAGRWIVGILTGIIAFLIKSFSSFPDGVLFAVIFAHVFTPIIDEGLISFKYRKLQV